MNPEDQIDQEKQRQILEALTQKYQEAGDTSGVDQAIKERKTADLISGLGQVLDTAAHAQTVSRGGQKADPTVFKMIAEQGQQGVQDARAKRQMAIDQAMKNIELNNQGLNQNMGIQSHNLGMQKGAKELGAMDRKVLQDELELKLGKQRLSAGNTSLKDSQDNHSINSNVTKLKQQLASQLMPGQDFSANTGAQLDEAFPQMKELFDKQATLKVEQQKAAEKLSPGQEAEDKEFAKNLVTYESGGGRAVNEKALENLDAIIKEFESGKIQTGGMGQRALSIGGQYSEGLRKAVSPELAAVKQRIQAAVLPGMKTMFPGSISNKESELFTELSFDPALPIEENIRKAKNKRDEFKSMVDTFDKQAQYYRANKGSLKGYKPSEEVKKDVSKSGPEVGSETDGYVFQGGDPSKPESWKKK